MSAAGSWPICIRIRIPPITGNAGGHVLVATSRPEKLTGKQYDDFAAYLRNVVMKDAFEA